MHHPRTHPFKPHHDTSIVIVIGFSEVIVEGIVKGVPRTIAPLTGIEAAPT
jgi:hypothetical protein